MRGIMDYSSDRGEDCGHDRQSAGQYQQAYFSSHKKRLIEQTAAKAEHT
jgi:hypothetical protein